jgi:broad specificity phosphatase PhoE
MTKPTIIYIVRHGLSEYNKAGIISGQVNPQLAQEGREQAKKAKQALAHINFDEVYSSDLDRAVETVGIIYKKPHTSRQLKDLRERSFGVIDGQPDHHLDNYHQIKMSLPPKERPHYKHAEGMESDHELASRYIEALNNIVLDHPGKTILIGSHGSAMRSVLLHIGWASHSELPPGSIDNTGYIKFLHNGQALIVDEVSGITLNR